MNEHQSRIMPIQGYFVFLEAPTDRYKKPGALPWVDKTLQSQSRGLKERQNLIFFRLLSSNIAKPVF